MKYNYGEMLMVGDSYITTENETAFVKTFKLILLEYIQTGRIKALTKDMLKSKELTPGQRHRLAALSAFLEKNIHLVYGDEDWIRRPLRNNYVEFTRFLSNDGGNFFSAMARDKVDVKWDSFFAEYIFNEPRTRKATFGDSKIYKDWKIYSDDFDEQYEKSANVKTL